MVGEREGDDVGESIGDVVGESEGDVVSEYDGETLGEADGDALFEAEGGALSEYLVLDTSSSGSHDSPNGGKLAGRRSPQRLYFFSTHDQIPLSSPYGLSHEHSTVGPQVI